MLARLRKSIAEKDEGFTLIELLVVIIIIGILAAIAIPVFLNQQKKGYDAQAQSDVRNLVSFETSYQTDNATNAYLGGAYTAGSTPTNTLSGTGKLDGWNPSSSTQSVTATAPVDSTTQVSSLFVDALSKSGQHICYASSGTNAAKGLYKQSSACPTS